MVPEADHSEHLLLLGKLTSNFQALETVLASIAWRLIGEEEVGQAVTSLLPFKRICDLLASLLRLRVDASDPILAELDALLGRAEVAENLRNQFVHSAWALAEGSEGFDRLVRLKITARRKQGLRLQEDFEGVAALKEAVTELASVCNDVLRFNASLAERRGAE